MWDEAQTLYIEEVLGVSVEHFKRSPPLSKPIAEAAPVTARTKVHAAIVTPDLNDDEQKLLTKILGSINISGLDIYKVLPLDLEVAHVLAFNGSSGVHQAGACTHWGLPRLAQMCGAGPEVNAHKRETWAQLQKFRDVYNAIAR